jgi:hypothetical protein
MTPGQQWAAAMRSHDFDRAWELSDRVLRELDDQKHVGPRHLQQIWRGERLENARVLVRCYHGLGDAIQFIRFAEPLRKIAREVTVWCQPELQGLLRRIPHIDRILPLHDGVVDATFDVDIEIMELAYALRVDAASIAETVPYLSFSAAPLRSKRSGLHVGAIWSAGAWDSRRSVRRQLLEPLASLPGVHVYSLHPGADLRGSSFIDWSSPSIETLAQRMAALDLVLTVDTMSAHLAGAMGLRVWTLLHSEADWRWGTGSRCVWYPTMRLYRQTSAGDWTAPVREVADAMAELTVRTRT